MGLKTPEILAKIDKNEENWNKRSNGPQKGIQSQRAQEPDVIGRPRGFPWKKKTS
jgi:hypothetical protein